jgi:hypothetical protein
MTDNLKNEVLKLLRSYRLTMTQDDEGNGYPLVDAVTPPGDAAITRGIEELEYLAEDISRTIEPLEAENKLLRNALFDQLNDCINFDGGKLTTCIMQASTAVLAATEPKP